MSVEVQQALKSWSGDQRVKKHIDAFCSKSTSLEEFLSERKQQSLKEKFAKKKKQKFSFNQLEEAVDYLRKYQKQHQQPRAHLSRVESGYDSVGSCRDGQPSSSSFSNSLISVVNRPLPPVPTASGESSSAMCSAMPTARRVEATYDVLEEKPPKPRPRRSLASYETTDDRSTLESAGEFSDGARAGFQEAAVACSVGPERGQHSESYASCCRLKICVSKPCNGNDLVGAQAPTPRPRHSLARAAASVKTSAACDETRDERQDAQNGSGAGVDAKARSSQNGCLNIRGTRNVIDCDLSALLMLQSVGPKWG